MAKKKQPKLDLEKHLLKNHNEILQQSYAPFEPLVQLIKKIVIEEIALHENLIHENSP